MFGHDDSNKHDDNTNPQHDGVLDGAAMVTDDMASPAFITTKPGDAADQTDTETVEASLPAPTAPALDDTAAGGDDLLSIKQAALHQLSPLVGHLNQTPEEKFRTTMMMIQASDNQALIKDAYEAAQAITDEKTKAQALLDIVNEINYFTQHGA
jgi:hypothetical protein